MNYTLKVEKIIKSRLESIDFNNLQFGRVFSDHMFVAEFNNGEWENIRIAPFDYLPMHPAMSSIHYGQSIFEGLKAKVNSNNEIIIFRPDMNLKRLNISAKRMAMPEIPSNLYFDGLTSLLEIDKNWIPKDNDSSLYIRPVFFATDEFIGIRRSSRYTFLIFTSPVSKYYNKMVRVYASNSYVRAFPGGTGFAKTAGNYARTIEPVEEIHAKGYDQILWLDGIEKKYLQEIGTMNVFIIIDGVVLTPSLKEGTILPGITRDSVIQLLKDWNIPVEERDISINEIIEAQKNGTLQDAFGAGTAATITKIKSIGYKDIELQIPDSEPRSISTKLSDSLLNIKNGDVVDPHNWIHKVQLQNVKL